MNQIIIFFFRYINCDFVQVMSRKSCQLETCFKFLTRSRTSRPYDAVQCKSKIKHIFVINELDRGWEEGREIEGGGIGGKEKITI